MKQRKAVDFLRGGLFVSATLVALTLGSGFAQAAPADNTTQTAGNAQVSGVVRDANGEPIIGANVIEKGTSNGTITDFDGKFTLTTAKNATLVVSYVGMKEKELRASKNMIVNLQEDAEVLEEVVVVGYGTQKKANLTGSVSSVDVSKTLESKSMNDVSRALQGAVPGLTVTNVNGSIDSDPSVVIRGIGTLSNDGATNPLYVVDGVPVESLGYLNPADIENISVLKDASSTSIYGTKAAFGVVLVTTKSAKSADKCKVTYSNNFAWSQATTLPNYSDVMTQITAQNEANYNMGLESELFGMLLDTERYQEGVKKSYEYYGGKKALAQQMKYGIDYDEKGYYTDWDVVNIMFNKAAPSQTHNLSVQGNSGKTQYYMSIGYNDQQGILNYHPDKLKKYNATLNLSTQANEWLTVGARFNYSNKISETNTGRGSNSYQYLWRWGSFFGPYGYWEDEAGNKIYGKTFQGALATAGDAVATTSIMRTGGFFKIDFLPASVKNHKFDFNGDYTYTRRDVGYKSAYVPYTIYNTWGMLGEDPTPVTYATGYDSWLTESTRTYQRHVMNAYFNYNGTFAQHNHLNVMVGANLDKDEQKYLVLDRNNLMDYNMLEMNLTNDTTVISVSDCYHTHNGSVGFFGRINYDYKGIYLIELNGRADASSKFPSHTKWGFFPSASIGYRVSEEAYFEKAKEYVSNMKLRASYGTIGNQEIGSAMFLETMNKYDASVAWMKDGSDKLGYVGQPALVSSTLTWETIATTNIGVDLGFLKNSLNVTFDWFQRENMNMLAPAKELPNTVGQSAAWENAGSMRTRGWELTIDWRQRFGDWNVYATANLNDYKTKITKWDSNGLLSENYAGKEYGTIWGFETERYFTNDDFNEDGSYKAGVADQTLLQGTVGGQSFVYGPGDIKFKDQNGDGVIDWGDGTEESHGDLIKIGNFTPRWQYSLRAGFDWNIAKGKGGNLDFDLFFQGVGKRDMWTQSAFVMPFMRGVDAVYDNMTSYVTREMIATGNIDQNADFPRMWGGGAAQGNCKVINMGSGNFYPQTKYLVNMAYLRLKNITLGYTLPRELTRKATIERVRVYGSILNPLDVINHNHGTGLDPEINTGVGSYGNAVWGRTEPIYRTYSVGLQVEF